MKRRSSVTLVRFLAAVLPLVLLAQTPTTPVSQRPSFTVDLRAQTISGVVPFDQPFYLTGAIPASVKSVEVFILDEDLMKKAGVPTAIEIRKEPDHEINLKELEPFRPKDLKQPIKWQRDPVFGSPAGQGGDVTFTLLIPHLEASHHYKFVFDIRAAISDVATFKAQASKAISAMLERQNPWTIHSSKGFTELQNALADLLDGDTKTHVVRSGTILAPAQTDSGLKKFASLLVQIENHYGHRAAAFKEVNPSMDQARASLGDLDLGPIQALLASMKKVAGENKEIKDQLDGHTDLVNLVGLDKADWMALGRGATPAHPDQTINTLDLTVPLGEAQERAVNLQQTHDLLLALGRWLDDLSHVELVFLAKIPAGYLKSMSIAVSKIAIQVHEAKSNVEGFASNSVLLTDAITRLVDSIETELRSVTIISPDTTGDFQTASSNYLSADAGLLYTQVGTPGFSRVIPYLGTNIYFRPVNKDAPLKDFDSWGRRLSLTIGLSLSSVADKTRDDLFGHQSLVLGFGCRLSSMIRMGTGALFFQKHDTNPFSDRTKIGSSLYVSVSFDFNVAKGMKGLGQLFTQ